MNIDRRDEYNFRNIWIYRNIKKKTINLFLFNSGFKIPTYSLEVQISKDIFNIYFEIN